MEDFAEQILRFVQARGYKPQKLQELAEAMGIGAAEQGHFHAACKALMKTGRVVLGSRDALMLPPPPGKLIGTYRGNARGFGFVIPDTPNAHGDLYIPSGSSGGAITGDTVSVRVMKRGKRAGKMIYEGRVVAIVRRGQSRFVGELRREFARWFVVPDGNALHVPILVGDAGAKGAKPGDQVTVELTQYPDEDREARGVIVKVLGPRGEPAVETLSIIEQYQLPGEFSEAVLAETRDVVTAYDPREESGTREDLRKLTVITIDPIDARDFDDAISLTNRRDGTVELGVHIADVAHFVREGGELDEEAKARSTSVYLPGTVIPMLPESLSNGVCSLQERQPRLTKSVFITYDRHGAVTDARLANTIIRSNKRLTYEQAGKVLDGKPGRMSANVIALLKDMENLARLIRTRRLRDGMLELDLPDVELVFDDDGRVVDVQPEDTAFSHKIIEMFMVEANEAVSRLLTDRRVPHLRRVHDQPRDLAGGSLRQFVAALGHDVPADPDRFALQALLDEVRGNDDAFAVNLAVLRSMQRAEYAPATIGHYALASEHYCHFTSPIRRYPDLTVHRLVDLYVAGAFEGRKRRPAIPTEAALVELGDHCTANEQRAEAAERELKLVLLLRLLEDRVGDELSGIVTGVANVGVFVQIERYLIDGLLRFGRLADDWWNVDAAHGCVIGERTGHTITIGDRLSVAILRVHVPTRQLDLALAQPLTGSSSRRKSSTRATSRKRPTSNRKTAPNASATTKRKRRATPQRGRRNPRRTR